MTKEKKYIRTLVNKVINESIKEQADSIVKKLKLETLNKDGDSKPKPKPKDSENKISMSEGEMIDFIEKIVKEQKAIRGMDMYKKSHKESGTENKDNLKNVAKKIKDYLKDGSKGTYETDPKVFPKGNGELAKMDKKAYRPSKSVDEFIENFAYSPGMENLDYDEIKPNEDWVTKNIEGSEMTGNSPKYANAVDTGLGKKVNEKRKKNYYAKLKKQSYNKAPQPVTDIAGETQNTDSMKIDKMFKTLESTSDNEKVIMEELNKINKLFNYNNKTQ